MEYMTPYVLGQKMAETLLKSVQNESAQKGALVDISQYVEIDATLLKNNKFGWLAFKSGIEHILNPHVGQYPRWQMEAGQIGDNYYLRVTYYAVGPRAACNDNEPEGR